jgi:thioredoxin-related protein
MKRSLLTVMALSLIISLYADASEIEWYRNVDAAVAKAGERNVILMVDVYTKWCGWCGKLDDEVFIDGKIIELSEKMVALKVDAEDGAGGQALADRYGVESYPTILFLRADGEEVDRINGFLYAPEFLEEMTRIFEGRATFLALKEKVDESPADPEIVVPLAQKYLERGLTDNAVPILTRYMETTADKKSEQFQMAAIMLMQANLIKGNPAGAEELGLKFRRDFPDSRLDAQAVFFLFAAAIESGKIDAARSYMKELQVKHPGEERLIAIAGQVLGRLEQ